MNELIEGEPGLRERKRTATFTAIHEAAAGLALEGGLEHATVHAISERANVSSRTFFNYFSSKEDAILGINITELDEEAITALTRTDDLLHDVAALVFTVMSGHNHAHNGLRRTVLEKYPQLILRQIARVTDLEDRLSVIVAGWLATAPNFDTETAEEQQESARLLLSVCLTAMRFAMKNFTHNPAVDPAVDPAADPQKNYTRAVDLLRTAMAKVS